jgi:hypothetical protein
MAIGDVPLTPIIDPVTGAVTEIGRIFLRTLTEAGNNLAPLGALYWTSRSDGILLAEVNLGALASGYLKIASAGGTATPATVAAIPQADISGLAGTLAGYAPLASPALTGTPSTPQLAFPAVQVPSAGANVLDDYEEGTWIPSVGGTATYSAQVGFYTKIGRLVSVQGQIAITAIGTGNTSTISGLPFAAATVTAGAVGTYAGLAIAASMVACYVNGATISLTSTAGGAAPLVGAALLGNGANLYFAATYLV